MRLTVTIDREEDGRYIGEVTELSGCLVYGATRAEADARARALALHILADEVEYGERSARSVSDLYFEAA
jgi:predicted RNase H-like HicB family nuclease